LQRGHEGAQQGWHASLQQSALVPSKPSGGADFKGTVEILLEQLEHQPMEPFRKGTKRVAPNTPGTKGGKFVEVK